MINHGATNPKFSEVVLFGACYQGAQKYVELCISNRINVNSKDPEDPGWRYRGSTPLHYAAKGGHLTIAKYLLSKGATINEKCEICYFLLE